MVPKVPRPQGAVSPSTLQSEASMLLKQLKWLMGALAVLSGLLYAVALIFGNKDKGAVFALGMATAFAISLFAVEIIFTKANQERARNTERRQVRLEKVGNRIYNHLAGLCENLNRSSLRLIRVTVETGYRYRMFVGSGFFNDALGYRSLYLPGYNGDLLLEVDISQPKGEGAASIKLRYNRNEESYMLTETEISRLIFDLDAIMGLQS